MCRLAALPVLAMAPTAHAAGSAARETFEFHSLLNDKCLATNGDNVEVQTCHGTGNQLWFWEGKVLRNLAELHCLDVRSGELDAAAQAVGDCHGPANQRWTREGQWLRTEVNNQCLSIQNYGDPSEHAGINVRNCGNVAWQFWKTV
nr:RICIN domain-containing protein [Streptomyces sp. NBC_01001]